MAERFAEKGRAVAEREGNARIDELQERPEADAVGNSPPILYTVWEEAMR